MAGKLRIEDAKTPAPQVHFVGLVKTGYTQVTKQAQYAVVTGTIDKPEVDKVSQPLEYACEAAKLAWLKLVESIP